MISKIQFIVLFFLFSVTLSAQSEKIVFTNATIIDVVNEKLIPDRTIIVIGNQIAQVGASGKVKIPKGAKVIDVNGKFLMPGLWDMHAHLDDPELWHVNPSDVDKEVLLKLLISHGVTGVRDMGGSLKLMQGWRERISAGTLLGPRIFAPGPLLDGPKPSWDGSIAISNETQARDAVRQVKKDGADFAKVYSGLPREAFFAIADEAKKLGISFAGHVPDSVTPEEASDAGQKSEEHLLQILSFCSDRDSIQKKLQEMRNAGASNSEIRHTRIEMMLVSFSEDKAIKLFAKFVKNDTWQTPTLIIWKTNAFFEEDLPKNEERIKYLPRYIQDYWNPQNNAHLKSRDPQRLADDKRVVEKNYQIVGLMQKAGVKLLAGSDFGANPLLFPGWGVHDEMALMVKSGLTPMQALQTATINPVRYLNLEKTLGSIEKGKFADFILLDANPLNDISNTMKINTVVANGKFIGKLEIEKMMADIAETNRK